MNVRGSITVFNVSDGKDGESVASVAVKATGSGAHIDASGTVVTGVSSVEVNGVKMDVNFQRGLTLLRLDAKTGAFVSMSQYDTYGETEAEGQTACAELAAALDGDTTDNLAVIVSFDATQLTTGLLTAMQSYGLSVNVEPKGQVRCAFALVGQKGMAAGRGSWALCDVIGDNTVSATASVSASVVDGVLIASGADGAQGEKGEQGASGAAAEFYRLKAVEESAHVTLTTDMSDGTATETLTVSCKYSLEHVNGDVTEIETAATGFIDSALLYSGSVSGAPCSVSYSDEGVATVSMTHTIATTDRFTHVHVEMSHIVGDKQYTDFRNVALTYDAGSALTFTQNAINAIVQNGNDIAAVGVTADTVSSTVTKLTEDGGRISTIEQRADKIEARVDTGDIILNADKTKIMNGDQTNTLFTTDESGSPVMKSQYVLADKVETSQQEGSYAVIKGGTLQFCDTDSGTRFEFGFYGGKFVMQVLVDNVVMGYLDDTGWHSVDVTVAMDAYDENLYSLYDTLVGATSIVADKTAYAAIKEGFDIDKAATLYKFRAKRATSGDTVKIVADGTYATTDALAEKYDGKLFTSNATPLSDDNLVTGTFFVAGTTPWLYSGTESEAYNYGYDEAVYEENDAAIDWTQSVNYRVAKYIKEGALTTVNFSETRIFFN